MKLRVAIVGCGMIAIKRHFPEMSENPNVELVGCTDYRLQRAEEMANRYGCKAYSDYQTLLREAKPDAVVVCTTNSTHCEVTVAALEAGAHVLCEKPMAASLEEAKRMVDAAERSGKKLMIAQNQRMSAAYQKGKEILETGKLGRVLTFSTKFGHPGCEFWSIDGGHSWFFRKEEAVFGCLADLGVHKVDLMRWLLSEEFEEAASFSGTLDKKDDTGNVISVDDNMVGILRSKSGIIGTVATSWTYYGPEDNSTVLYCQKGILSICADPEFAVKIDYPDGTQECYRVAGVGSNDKPIKTGICDEFIQSILEDRLPAIPGRDGYNSLAVAVALNQAAQTGRYTKVSHYEDCVSCGDFPCKGSSV